MYHYSGVESRCRHSSPDLKVGFILSIIIHLPLVATMQRLSRTVAHSCRRCISTTRICQVMKPGTPIPGLQLKTGQEQIVALKREEYPEWIDTLTTPKPSIAKLRKMDINEDTPDVDLKRYLRLTRRAQIKENNAEAGGG